MQFISPVFHKEGPDALHSPQLHTFLSRQGIKKPRFLGISGAQGVFLIPYNKAVMLQRLLSDVFIYGF